MVVVQKMQLPLAGIRADYAALKVLEIVLSRVNMRNKRSNVVILDRAYDDGKLAGFLGLETTDACPYGADQPGARIAWLDGFDYGAWKGASKVNAYARRRTTAGRNWTGLTCVTSIP